MLCSVAHIAPYVSLEIIFIHIFQLTNFFTIEAALPPGAEDEIVLIEHLPGRQVHLQDFFWTGADDAPPWLDPDQTLNFYETRTIHHTATVYVSGEDQDRDGSLPGVGPHDPGCINCIDPTPTLLDPDQDIGVLVGEDPGPRYWLLTVLRSGESVPPKVELRLARLYRAAFARQQQRHLGLLAADPRLRRATNRRISPENHKPIANNRVETIVNGGSRGTTVKSMSLVTDPPSERTSKIDTFRGKRMREVKISEDDHFFRINRRAMEHNSHSTLLTESTRYSTTESVDKLPISTSTATTESVDNEITSRSTNQEGTTQLIDPNASEITPNDSAWSSMSSTMNEPGDPQLLRSDHALFYPDFNEDSFEPTILTKSNTEESSTENDVRKSQFENWENGKLMNENTEEKNYQLDKASTLRKPELNSTGSGYRLRTAGFGMVQVRMQNTTVLEDGATRLIYSVHLGGKPVPAETAAKDMALLSPQEVALELGAPVIIQGEPYLKETQPLALSRKSDALLLVGAAGVALIFLLVLAGIILAVKRKKAHSSVSAPPTQSILKKDNGGYTSTTPGLDNTGYTSETEGRTDGTSQRQTPGSISRSPDTLITPNTLDDEIQDLSSDNEEEVKGRVNEPWDIEEYPISGKKSRAGRRRMTKMNAMERPESPDSMDTVIDRQEQRDSLGNGCLHTLEETASPHSYLSMPSCKLFPSMRSVEPLSRILEPVVVRHLDMEFETPEMLRRGNGFAHGEDESLGRTRSALKDPGVVGPIVWDLRRQRAVEENGSLETDVERQPPSSGPVGRARRRLHELLEDSFSLFGTKDAKMRDSVAVSSTLRPNSAAISPDRITMLSESREKSTHVSPTGSPANQLNIRPRTSLPRSRFDELILETGNAGPQTRGAWGSRPLSAGPFHRPNLPEVNVTRVLADTQLAPEDPAVPLIAAIRKELEKFTPERA